MIPLLPQSSGKCALSSSTCTQATEVHQQIWKSVALKACENEDWTRGQMRGNLISDFRRGTLSLLNGSEKCELELPLNHEIKKAAATALWQGKSKWRKHTCLNISQDYYCSNCRVWFRGPCSTLAEDAEGNLHSPPQPYTQGPIMLCSQKRQIGEESIQIYIVSIYVNPQ